MSLNINFNDFNKKTDSKQVASLNVGDSSSFLPSLFDESDNISFKDKGKGESIFQPQSSIAINVVMRENEKEAIVVRQTPEADGAGEANEADSIKAPEADAVDKAPEANNTDKTKTSEKSKMSPADAYEFLKKSQAEENNNKIKDLRDIFDSVKNYDLEKIEKQHEAEKAILTEKTSRGISFIEASKIISAIEKKYRDDVRGWTSSTAWTTKDGYEVGTKITYDFNKLVEQGLVSEEDLAKYDNAKAAMKEQEEKYPDVDIYKFSSYVIRLDKELWG